MKQHANEDVDLLDPTVSSRTLLFRELVVNSEAAFLQCSPWAPGQADQSLGQIHSRESFHRVGPVSGAGIGSHVKVSTLMKRQRCDGTREPQR